LFVCSYFHFPFFFFVLTQLTQRDDMIFRVDTRRLLITLDLIFDWYLLLRPFSVQYVWFVLLFHLKCCLMWSTSSSFVCDWYLFLCHHNVFVEFNFLIDVFFFFCLTVIGIVCYCLFVLIFISLFFSLFSHNSHNGTTWFFVWTHVVHSSHWT
jgi:hypothetical protein